MASNNFIVYIFGIEAALRVYAIETKSIEWQWIERTRDEFKVIHQITMRMYTVNNHFTFLCNSNLFGTSIIYGL